MSKCTCGTPSKANWYVELIIGRGDSRTGTETDYQYDFYCDQHLPNDAEIKLGARLTGGWEVLESTVTELR